MNKFIEALIPTKENKKRNQAILAALLLPYIRYATYFVVFIASLLFVVLIFKSIIYRAEDFDLDLTFRVVTFYLSGAIFHFTEKKLKTYSDERIDEKVKSIAQRINTNADQMVSKASEFTANLPNLVESTSNAVKQKIDIAIANRKATDAKLRVITARSLHPPIEVFVLGGSGWESARDDRFLLSIDRNIIYLNQIDKDLEYTLDFTSILGLIVEGPGTVVKNAGLAGGGFGIEGAALGIAAATLVNLLTTNIKTTTIIAIRMLDQEIFIRTEKIEPDEARIMLSGAIVAASNPKVIGHNSIADELIKLQTLLQQGLLSQEEFNAIKSNLIKD